MTSKFFKTSGGEVYGKCGILFGAEPVEVSAAKLAERTDRGLVGERLAADARLMEVAAPVKPDEPRKTDEPNGRADDEGDKDKGGKDKGGKK